MVQADPLLDTPLMSRKAEPSPDFLRKATHNVKSRPTSASAGRAFILVNYCLSLLSYYFCFSSLKYNIWYYLPHTFIDTQDWSSSETNQASVPGLHLSTSPMITPVMHPAAKLWAIREISVTFRNSVTLFHLTFLYPSDIPANLPSLGNSTLLRLQLRCSSLIWTELNWTQFTVLGGSSVSSSCLVPVYPQRIWVGHSFYSIL